MKVKHYLDDYLLSTASMFLPLFLPLASSSFATFVQLRLVLQDLRQVEHFAKWHDSSQQVVAFCTEYLLKRYD